MLARLGVNIDHIATLRQLRGTPYPSVLEAAKICEVAGAEQITVHLREDRRHIQDADVKGLRSSLKVPLNLEMAASPEMVKFAARLGPDWACLVPEKRKEVTTEGGLDIKKNKTRVGASIQKLKAAGIKVSLFIEADPASVKLAAKLGADAVEFHTGRYCMAAQGTLPKRLIEVELKKLKNASVLAKEIGIHPHAGHGFDFENVRPVAEWVGQDGKPLIEEFNIGHAIICRAAIVGLDRAVREMVSAIRAP
jgi:pyridoxine 5-phosphate synthase